MKIGVDMDDTICRTTEIVHDRLEQYSQELGINPLDIMNDDELQKNFFAIYAEDIYSNAEIKRNVASVLRRLRSKGNEIIILTSRGDEFSSSNTNAYDVTKEWLVKNNIEVDGIFTNIYGPKRAEVVRDNQIDIVIDNDPYNFREINASGGKCILFDDRERFALKDKYVTNWLDVEKYIERSR